MFKNLVFIVSARESLRTIGSDIKPSDEYVCIQMSD